MSVGSDGWESRVLGRAMHGARGDVWHSSLALALGSTMSLSGTFLVGHGNDDAESRPLFVRGGIKAGDLSLYRFFSLKYGIENDRLTLHSHG